MKFTVNQAGSKAGGDFPAARDGIRFAGDVRWGRGQQRGRARPGGFRAGEGAPEGAPRRSTLSIQVLAHQGEFDGCGGQLRPLRFRRLAIKIAADCPALASQSRRFDAGLVNERMSLGCGRRQSCRFGRRPGVLAVPVLDDRNWRRPIRARLAELSRDSLNRTQYCSRRRCSLTMNWSVPQLGELRSAGKATYLPLRKHRGRQGAHAVGERYPADPAVFEPWLTMPSALPISG